MVRITEGKFRGMQAVADSTGVIRAAAMDQRGSLEKSIATAKKIDRKAVTPQMMSEFKVAVTKVLTPHASAILLDPEFGLEAVKARAPETGVLLAYESTGYDNTQPGRLPQLIATCTVRKNKDYGADCLKLLVHYTPFEKPAINETKHAFVERVGQECVAQDMPFFLEFVGYDVSPANDEKGLEYAKLKPDIVARSMEEFSKPQYAVDVLKVEIPVNMQYMEGAAAFAGKGVAYTKKQAMEHYRRCAKVATKPFIYLSAGVSDAQFRESLELAIEAGVSFAGVLCGRATWKDGIPVYAEKGYQALEAWLRDRGVANIQALNQVLAGAHPWYDAYGGREKIKVVKHAA